ncbi:Pleckstrin homology domain-containing protein [Epithele typhae]|uniref:Pleckstrin homology domain-containing protein n=1 Tax=Epithele typhae TaxID=378194 RepID=UPI002007E624|nr:Pleckstrin homology domain-containing protein [Epithele typhae]KAH9922789.1 Pleckstrin homology domain-containing protein [Epithele typhae]
MRKRWRESEWGRIRKQQKQGTGTGQKWVGGSFDVGVFLGVDVLDQELPLPPASPPDIVFREPSPSARPPISTQSPSAEAETFVTAPSRASTGPPIPHGRPPEVHAGIVDSSPNSSTALLAASGAEAARDTHSEPGSSFLEPNTSGSGLGVDDASRRPPLDDARRSSKGKNKDVRFSQDIPAPPREVLARTGSAVKTTSAGAAEQQNPEESVPWGGVIMRDRMLVRISYTEDSVSPTFDERQNRTTRHLETNTWKEYLVAWRKGRIEIYRDHVIPGKEWLLGTKCLAFVVPLSSAATRLSLYSFLDLSFCLTCPPVPLQGESSRRHRIFGTSRGTNIFVFKLKSRTRAVDWVWQMWRAMGGQLPPSIEINITALDTRVTIDVPGHDAGDIDAAYDVFQKKNITQLIETRLREAPEYRSLLEREQAAGTEFEFAWRHDTDLDWVWRERTVVDEPRKWAMLSGLALRQADRPAHLEFHKKRHVYTTMYMKDRTRLDEPHGIEGYVDRIRPNSQTRQSLFLTTHDGYIFTVAPLHAHPPAPPGAPVDITNVDKSVTSFHSHSHTQDTRHRAEIRRGRMQILQAAGVSDLRNVVFVRRAFQPVPQPRENANIRKLTDWEDSPEFWDAVDRSESDDEDAGGDAPMNVHTDKAHLRMRRSFELVLASGRVIRFEAYSCSAALEWITRLRQLVSYWKKRHQADARLEMDIAHVSTGRERITPHKPREEHHHAGAHEMPTEPPPDRDAALPDLSFFYNWCVLEGCRPILKAGRLYGRKGLYGQYKHIQLVLIAGHLVQFHITGRASLYHRKDKVFTLLDAYVCSGYFAAQYLPDGQYDANAPPVARRYQDGLETDDCEEDTLFVLWFRKVRGAAPGVRRNSNGAEVPPLSAKRSVAVFRTRSKLERDAWVWAINVEIEKLVRASREREEAVRQAGNLPPCRAH